MAVAMTIVAGASDDGGQSFHNVNTQRGHRDSGALSPNEASYISSGVVCTTTLNGGIYSRSNPVAAISISLLEITAHASFLSMWLDAEPFGRQPVGHGGMRMRLGTETFIRLFPIRELPAMNEKIGNDIVEPKAHFERSVFVMKSSRSSLIAKCRFLEENANIEGGPPNGEILNLKLSLPWRLEQSLTARLNSIEVHPIPSNSRVVTMTKWTLVIRKWLLYLATDQKVELFKLSWHT
ncbi:hypothetical protein GGS21DRAFT_494429 [Xylaria nigripes]|nr:hypothetical protein GGS21DRAFT_494429 [Xylaria nigripes]